MYDEVILQVRLVNCLLGVIAFVWLLMRINARWTIMRAEDRAGRSVLLLFTFAVVYASGESVAMNSPPGVRTWLVLLAILALLLHLTMLTRKKL